MATTLTLQIHAANRWNDAATVTFADEAAGRHGPTTLDYDLDYCLTHDPDLTGTVIGHTALSVRYPLSLEWRHSTHWPPFLLDLLPQGRPREVLAATLGLDANSPSCDAPLLRRAGGSPVGNIRVKEAWEAEQTRLLHFVPQGLKLDDVFNLDERFLTLADAFAAQVSGSSGVQGAWPKVLLTQARDGLWYPDPLVADSEAKDHAIVKWIGDKHESTSLILAAEAPYLELARHFGLRCARPLLYRNGVLVMPRFDRQIQDDRVIRFGQESLTAASGIAAFGHETSHEAYLTVIKACCTDPATEVTEYVLRDVLNLALGNPDNHGRNTALQKAKDGSIRLTPLFDFCPMRLDPTGIRRTTTWACMRTAGGASRDLSPDWNTVCDAAADGVMDQAELKASLASKAEILRSLPARARVIGVPAVVIERAMARCEEIAATLDQLRIG